jgi:hypothetical protein
MKFPLIFDRALIGLPTCRFAVATAPAVSAIGISDVGAATTYGRKGDSLIDVARLD